MKLIVASCKPFSDEEKRVEQQQKMIKIASKPLKKKREGPSIVTTTTTTRINKASVVQSSGSSVHKSFRSNRKPRGAGELTCEARCRLLCSTHCWRQDAAALRVI